MIKLLIADDHDILRAGLCRLLEDEPDIEVVGEAGGGHEAVKLCRELEPDVLLLDLDMPDLDGLEVTRQVIEANLKTKIFVLTMFGHEEYAVRALEAGAKGFSVKGISHTELPDAIRKVAGGKMHISESIMAKTFMRQNHMGGGDPMHKLSERELQVFLRLARGASPNEISEELCLSDSSVRTYKSRIMEKLNIENLSELIRLALRNGLISKF